MFLALLLLAGTAPGEAEKAVCTAENAHATAIDTVQNNADAWMDVCVSIEGILSGNLLLADRQALLEEDAAYGEDAKRSIAIYPNASNARFDGPPARVVVVGTIGSCARHHEIVAARQAAEPNMIMMVSGYCHTSLRNYVMPVSMRIVAKLKPDEMPLLP
jgi:hypothetical protein